MVNVNATDLQADAHLIRFPDGETDFIDVADSQGLLIAYLKSHRISTIDKVFITHPHKDHYGGLLPLLNAHIKIKEVFMNVPDRGICDSERDWGCDYPHVLHTIQTLKDLRIPVREAKAGDVVHRSGQSKLEILYAYDGVHTPIGRTDINDMSLVMRLTHGKTRVLFTGDLNHRLGEYLSHRTDVRADILKVPHHGTEGVAPNAFFEQVGMRVALVPSPKTLWLSDRSRRVREYFHNKGIPTYVNGLDGTVTVLLDGTGYKITTEKSPAIH